ncbi:hypothetical protein MiYa_00325 [Microcystis aeruginosa NIES-2519]|uniref:Uncharacterized protein n=1 Tax=Microcystis aeruginosa NIES-2519 TaxID=2303981 RepID=A0A5A5R2C0_MICAE|nr:hypothetical protein MiYa_00325 [Microcystis aeruginosa NIES-2519]
MKKFSPPQMKEVSFPTPHTRSDPGLRLRTFGGLSRADGEPVEPPRELLSNAELTAKA